MAMHTSMNEQNEQLVESFTKKLKLKETASKIVPVAQELASPLMKVYESPPEMLPAMIEESRPMWKTTYANHIMALPLDPSWFQCSLQGPRMYSEHSAELAAVAKEFASCPNATSKDIKSICCSQRGVKDKSIASIFTGWVLAQAGIPAKAHKDKAVTGISKELEREEDKGEALNNAETADTMTTGEQTTIFDNEKSQESEDLQIGTEYCNSRLWSGFVTIAKTAGTYCQRLADKIDKLLMEPPSTNAKKSAYKVAWRAYTEAWENYVKSSLLIQEEFGVLSTKFLAGCSEPCCLSLVMLLRSVFKRCCYKPLKQKLTTGLRELIKAERRLQGDIIKRRKPRVIKPVPRISLERYLAGEIDYHPEPNHISVPMISNLLGVRELEWFVNSLVDMNIRPGNSYYVTHSKFRGNTHLVKFARALSDDTLELYGVWQAAKLNHDVFLEMMCNDLKVLRIITIPSMRTFQEQTIQQFALLNVKTNIEATFSNFLEGSEVPPSDQVVPQFLVPKLREDFGSKLRTNNVHPHNFAAFLLHNHPTLVEQYECHVKLLNNLSDESLVDSLIAHRCKNLPLRKGVSLIPM